MALTQIQIMQSLGEAMAWFERELQWGVPSGELSHLIGRIGELYAALITNGQMATDVNQKGYDVVSALGERVSVKTTSMMGSDGHSSFNPNTLDKVDRVLILRINTEEMQIDTLLNATTEEARKLMSKPNSSGKVSIAHSKSISTPKKRSDIFVIKTVIHGPYIIRELETGTIEVEANGEIISPTKPVLRKIADKFNIGLLNSNGNPYNTRQLGSLLISTPKKRSDILTINTATYEAYRIWELETGKIEVEANGEKISPAQPVLPVLREIAAKFNIGLLNSNGNPHNTRQLGSLLIRAINSESEDNT